ncbi:IclR family transcriptional regulator [Rhabdobacter roseus]|uniref:DNA-binding IclR family transcriptional regulator n=1 Tax=Rhabdobacter roseus TaxID=1655419 RepID=A0A840TVV6_9BACT|nr:IclR family transcriptional regulator [Rhabdobacter roseus]MBB5284090.1 DNA-binding IclR family transcriptional regulator [Rhabdobacter roseus]
MSEAHSLEDVKKDGDESSKYHVPNLERALQLMELLAQHPAGLGITEISNLLQIPKNSTFRIATTLLNFGYLARDESSKAFTLSGKLLSLGYAAVSDQNLVEKSLDVMRSLRDTLRETVLIGVILNDEGIVLDQVPGLHSFKFWVDVGTRFPMHTAVPSKAMLAFLPQDIQKKICEKMDFKRYTDHTITNLSDFYEALQTIKEKGYAVDFGEEVDAMHCVGAPVFDRNGYPVAAIWITGPADRLPASSFEAIGHTIQEHARRISQRLGYYTT